MYDFCKPMIVAILQARMSSTRLPGKVLKPVLGEAMLVREAERVGRSNLIDHLIVATSTDATDDPIEVLCQEHELSCYRGSLEDVLDRFYRAVKPMQPDGVVRLTGDCPLIDHEIIDKVISAYIAADFDYVSNTIKPTYPDGQDVEVLSFESLEVAWNEAVLPNHREHVTPFIHNHPDRFRLHNVENQSDLSGLRWTVDELVDFQLISKIYEAIYPVKPDFNMHDVVDYLEKHQQLMALNSHIKRNAGAKKSC